MKKKILSLLFIGLFLALCLIPSLGLLLGHGSGAAANQKLAAEPKLTGRGGGFNTQYPEQLGSYLNDRFALRQEAVTLWSRLNASLLGSSVTDQVVPGRDGWLYFAPTLPDFTRTQRMTARELWCAARRLYLLQEYAEAQGGQFLYLTAPNKNSLYPDRMPALPRAEGPSNAEALAPLLEEMGVCSVDLFALFRAETEELYFPRDSHWNGRGAALAADAMLAALGRDSAYYDADFTAGSHRGDLYEMLYPTGTALDPDLVYAPGFRFTASSDDPDKFRIDTVCETGEGELLMYRDSFGRALYPYLAEAFAEAHFSRSNSYDASAMAPGGTLVIELVERNLRYLIDYEPVLPAAKRDADLISGAVPAAGAAELRLAKGGPEGDTVLRGDLGGIVPEDDSPVFVETAQGLYEALPGPEGFSLCLPEAAPDGPIRVFFRSEGRLLSLEGSLKEQTGG